MAVVSILIKGGAIVTPDILDKAKEAGYKPQIIELLEDAM